MTKQQWKNDAGLGLLLAILLYVIVAAIYALIIPRWVDTDWAIIPSANLVTHGFLGMGNVPSHICFIDDTTAERYIYWFPPLHYLSLAGWFEAFGLGLPQVRWHTIFWGVVMLLGLTKVVKRDNSWIAVWAVFICALDYNFVNHADGRPDMMCAALGVWAIATRSEWVASLACMAHPIGCMYAVLLAIYNRRVNWLPYAVMAGLWGVYALQAPEFWWSQFVGNWIYHINGGDDVDSVGAYQAYGSGWRQILLYAYLVCVFLATRKNKDLALWFLLLAVPAFLCDRQTNYYPHALAPIAVCVATQIESKTLYGLNQWWILILIPLIVFLITTLGGYM